MKRRVLEYIDSQPWAITPDYLGLMRSIAASSPDEREGAIEAVERELGRPLRNTREVRVRSGIAVIPVHGPLFRYANLFTRISGGVSAEEIATDIGTALDDPNVRGIILDIDSPGGEVNGIEETAELIFQARSEKNITALVSGFGTSGAYWLASAAEHVATVQTGVLGSIGAVLRVRRDPKDERELVFVSSQSPLKNIDPTQEAGASEIQTLLDSLAQVFINTVARNRGITTEAVIQDFGRGGLLVGASAVERGLADRTTTLEALISELSAQALRSTGNQAAVAARNNEENLMPTDPKNPTPAADSTPTLTRASLEDSHPDLVAKIRSEGFEEGEEAGRLAGATQERERILAIEGLAVPGMEKLVAELKRDPEVTEEKAAIRIVQATQKAGASHLKSLVDAEKDLNAPEAGAHSGAEDNRPSPEERADRALALAGIRPSKN